MCIGEGEGFALEFFGNHKRFLSDGAQSATVDKSLKGSALELVVVIGAKRARLGFFGAARKNAQLDGFLLRRVDSKLLFELFDACFEIFLLGCEDL